MPFSQGPANVIAAILPKTQENAGIAGERAAKKKKKSEAHMLFGEEAHAISSPGTMSGS